MDGKERAEKAREHARFWGYDPDDLFRPNLDAEIDSTRSWVDSNGYRLSDRVWLAKDADRDAIDTILRQGLAAGDGVAGMASRLSGFLSPDSPGGNYGARRLARTETTRAFGAATVAAAAANPFVKAIKWSLSGSHHEPDECNTNASRSSRDMPKGEYTFDELPRYPAHPNCVTGETVIRSRGVHVAYRRWYDGELLRIVTRQHELSVTPNHPLLTANGFVAAQSLRVGDDLVCDSAAHDGARLDPYPDQRPTEIAEIFALASILGTCERIAGRRPQFHGDGCDADVEIVTIDGLLLDGALAEFKQPASHNVFSATGVRNAQLLAESALAQVGVGALYAPNGVVRGSRNTSALVSGDARVREFDRLLRAAYRDVASDKPLADRGATDTEELRKLFFGFAGYIATSDVVSIERYAFSGHVYNLQTIDNHYSCNGILSGNCLCNLQPVSISDEEFAQRLHPEDRRGMGDFDIDADGFVKDFTSANNPNGGSAAPHLILHADGTHSFTPERQALHDQIIREFVENIPVSNDPTVHMLGGGPAAGKSTMLKSGNLTVPEGGVDAVLVNPDEMKERLPEYRQMVQAKDETAASFVHEESSYLAKRAMKAAIQRGQDVLVDGVGVNYGKMMKVADPAGYKTKGYYAFLPNVDEAVARANARAAKTGRAVPEAYIREKHAEVSGIFEDAASKMASMVLYDTSDGARRVAEFDRGQPTFVDQEAYDHFLTIGSGH